MSETVLSRPASSLRHSPGIASTGQPNMHQGGISLLSGVATAAYAASFAQPEAASLPPLSRPREELRPTLSPYVPERQSPFPSLQPMPHQQDQQQHYPYDAAARQHSQLPPQPAYVSSAAPQPYSLAHHSLKPTNYGTDWWRNPTAPSYSSNGTWPERSSWQGAEIAQFMTRAAPPPIVVDSDAHRAGSDASSEGSLGSLPEEPDHQAPPRGAYEAAQHLPHMRPPFSLRHPASHHHHHPYLPYLGGQAPSPASSCHSLAPYAGRQESPVWSGFQNFTLSDHSSRPSSANAEALSPQPSPVSNLSRNHSMDSAQELLAAASAEDISQSEPESGPMRHTRTRARLSQVLNATDEDSSADLASKTTRATQQAAIARRKPGSEARFECPYCHSTFTRSYNLKGHIRAHKGERPFACAFEGCAKAFARHHDLKRHMELHAPSNRRHHCASCSKSFKRLEALLRHYQQEPDYKDAAGSSAEDGFSSVVSGFKRPSADMIRPSRRSSRMARQSLSDAEGEEDDDYQDS